MKICDKVITQIVGYIAATEGEIDLSLHFRHHHFSLEST